jgi:hypothetical protein
MFIMVFYLQQMWLDQNITQKLAAADEAKKYFTVFLSKLLSAKRVLSFPCSFETCFTRKGRNIKLHGQNMKINDSLV